MAHEFPKETLKPNEAPNAHTVSRLVTTIADKVAGGLNEHDVSTVAPFDVDQVQDGAYYRAHRVLRMVSPRWLGGVQYADLGGQGPHGTATIPDSPVWSPLTDDVDDTEEMSAAFTTGEEILFAIGQVQLISFLNGAADDVPSESPERTQIAIRYDGAVIQETITGAMGVPDMPMREIYRTPSTPDPAVQDFDFRHRFPQQNTVGINTNVAPVRVMYAWPTTEGEHTVDLVGRRLPSSTYQPDNGGDGSTVQAFNRMLVVLRLRGWAKGDGSSSTLTVDPYHDGDSFTATGLMADRLNVVRDEINDLRSRNIPRGTFRSEHLPSMVVNPRSASFVSPDGEWQTLEPYTSYGGAWGVVVTDGTDDLEVNMGLDLNTVSGVLVVLANVEVLKLTEDPPAANKRVCVMLSLRYKDQNGAWQYVRAAEMALHNRNLRPDFGTPGMANEEVGADMLDAHDDVPLTWVVDTANLVSAGVTEVNELQVISATWAADSAAASQDVIWMAGSGCLTAFLLRGVSLA